MKNLYCAYNYTKGYRMYVGYLESVKKYALAFKQNHTTDKIDIFNLTKQFIAYHDFGDNK